MADKRLDALLKTMDDSKMTLEQSYKFMNTKRKINAICKALSLETQKYNPRKTVENIDSYISSTNKLDRILYSEISNYVFSLNLSERGVFVTNLEKLLLFSLDSAHDINEDSRKLIIKIYDHSQLALYQIENVKNIFAVNIDDAKINLQKEIKGVEKEYISILGIFASIVLAFVGGITFSSSVLQNIASVSIYRLLIVIDLLALVLINVINILVRFVSIINNKDPKVFKIKTINIICLIIAFVILLGWILNIYSLSDFISSFLPWKK